MKKQRTVLSPIETVRHQIETVHGEMRDRCLAAGIHEQHYNKPLKGVEELSLEALEGLFSWLQEFYDGPYRDMLSIWQLKPADWWQNMETLFQQRKTREQKLLRAEYKKLRKAWYRRNGQPEESQEPIQDEAAGAPA